MIEVAGGIALFIVCWFLIVLFVVGIYCFWMIWQDDKEQAEMDRQDNINGNKKGGNK